MKKFSVEADKERVQNLYKFEDACQCNSSRRRNPANVRRVDSERYRINRGLYLNLSGV